MKGLNPVAGLLFGIILALLALVIIEGPVTDGITDVATEVITATSDATTADAVVTLANAHWYSSTKSLTVSASADGDVTATTTIGSDRKTLTIGTLTTGTAQTFTITQLAETSNTTLNIVLKIFPFLVLIASIGAAFGGIFVGVRGGMNEGLGMDVVMSILVVFIGAVLIPIVLSFTTLADDSYKIAPEFIGVTIMLPLVAIGYILGLLAMAFGSIAPGVRSAIGR